VADEKGEKRCGAVGVAAPDLEVYDQKTRDQSRCAVRLLEVPLRATQVTTEAVLHDKV